MSLQESGEMYLETIYILNEKKGRVRSLDIAEHMGFSKPSISRAVGLLKNGKYIVVDKDGFIELTDIGSEIAKNIYERHTILTEYLTELGVPSDIASHDACKMEHVISRETFEAIKKHMTEKQ